MASPNGSTEKMWSITKGLANIKRHALEVVCFDSPYIEESQWLKPKEKDNLVTSVCETYTDKLVRDGDIGHKEIVVDFELSNAKVTSWPETYLNEIGSIRTYGPDLSKPEHMSTDRIVTENDQFASPWFDFLPPVNFYSPQTALGKYLILKKNAPSQIRTSPFGKWKVCHQKLMGIERGKAKRQIKYALDPNTVQQECISFYEALRQV
ncbi:hypothetical protein B0H13DRAFT_1871340 [Mycena leptocephala]|nr:hypothetical protein B0H13DRAFT_1871340 [Mycena leptocephala]